MSSSIRCGMNTLLQGELSLLIEAVVSLRDCMINTPLVQILRSYESSFILHPRLSCGSQSRPAPPPRKYESSLILIPLANPSAEQRASTLLPSKRAGKRSSPTLSHFGRMSKRSCWRLRRQLFREKGLSVAAAKLLQTQPFLPFLGGGVALQAAEKFGITHRRCGGAAARKRHLPLRKMRDDS